VKRGTFTDAAVDDLPTIPKVLRVNVGLDEHQEFRGRIGIFSQEFALGREVTNLERVFGFDREMAFSASYSPAVSRDTVDALVPTDD
jgi:hypothetical protein